jgi:hypothetical protein
MMILGAFVSRSLRRRRRRSAAALTALTTGDYGRVTRFRGKFDKLPASKPTLWETRMIPVDDEAKGWVGIFVRLTNSTPLTPGYHPRTEESAVVSLLQARRWCPSRKRRIVM